MMPRSTSPCRGARAHERVMLELLADRVFPTARGERPRKACVSQRALRRRTCGGARPDGRYVQAVAGSGSAAQNRASDRTARDRISAPEIPMVIAVTRA